MSKLSVVGISITPTTLSGVRLALDTFEVETHTEIPLPPGVISADDHQLHQPDTLQPVLEALHQRLKLDDILTQVYISIHPPLLNTGKFHATDKKALSEELLQHIHQTFTLDDHGAVLQDAMLWEQGKLAAVAYAGIDNALIKQYTDLFATLGITIDGIDIIPFSVLRGLAASGVLDVLVDKIGPKAFWGCFGTSGSHTWCSIWQGKNLLQMSHFTTPDAQHQWELKIKETTAMLDIGSPKIWLCWTDNTEKLPCQPGKLSLGGPVRPANVGPMYMNDAPPLAALGAALKCDISFPLGWDFLVKADEFQNTIPLVEEHIEAHKEQRQERQKAFCKLFNTVAVLLLGISIVGSVTLTLINHQFARALDNPDKKIHSFVNGLHMHNQTYPLMFSLVNESVLKTIRLDHVELAPPSSIHLSGTAYSPEDIDVFFSRLTVPNTNQPIKLQHYEQSTSIPTQPGASYGFVFKAALAPNTVKPNLKAASSGEGTP